MQFGSSLPQSWMLRRPAPTPIATGLSNSESAWSNATVRAGGSYKVLGSGEWFEDPGGPIPPEITTITGITDEMVAGHRIDDSALDDLLTRVVLVIAHNADFDRRFLERRLPAFAAKHWACSRFDIDWKAEGIRSSALEFVAYSLGFFHDGHRAAIDCRPTLHALSQPLPGTGRLAVRARL